MQLSGYILGISRGHNAGACLLKDGEIIFSIEEERLSRHKYDGGPFAAMIKVKEYTDKLDFIVISHTQSLNDTGQRLDYTGDNVYIALARKLGLIERKCDVWNHPQVIDLSANHHKIHAACGFYRSGFDDAVIVVVDGAGTVMPATYNESPVYLWETETVITAEYPDNFKTVYKHYGCRDGVTYSSVLANGDALGEVGDYVSVCTDRAGITKVYEAVTEFSGFQAIEAGKLMGLAPYGKPNDHLPKLFNNLNGKSDIALSDRNFIIPYYPNSARVNAGLIPELSNLDMENVKDLTKLQEVRDLAYAVQEQTQEQVLKLILRAVEKTGKKNVVLTGGYALNCVANYYYLDTLRELGINLYVEPISNDGGTAIGVALWFYHVTSKSSTKRTSEIYLGPQYNYAEEDIIALSQKYGAFIEDADDDKIVDLLTSKNIVSIFQGRSENGPRALGNRSILFDPRVTDGKDYVNTVKRREYFRPFAGSILEEDVHDWFDLRGMSSTPHMMYAVNCKDGIAEKIPSIIHVDGTCRIQTVNQEQNKNYYNLISKFKERTGVPIIFNTSFNLGGEPLVETLEDALWTLQQSQIEYLYLPEYNKLLIIRNI